MRMTRQNKVDAIPPFSSGSAYQTLFFYPSPTCSNLMLSRNNETPLLHCTVLHWIVEGTSSLWAEVDEIDPWNNVAVGLIFWSSDIVEILIGIGRIKWGFETFGDFVCFVHSMFRAAVLSLFLRCTLASLDKSQYRCRRIIGGLRGREGVVLLRNMGSTTSELAHLQMGNKRHGTVPLVLGTGC